MTRLRVIITRRRFPHVIIRGTRPAGPRSARFEPTAFVKNVMTPVPRVLPFRHARRTRPIWREGGLTSAQPSPGGFPGRNWQGTSGSYRADLAAVAGQFLGSGHHAREGGDVLCRAPSEQAQRHLPECGRRRICRGWANPGVLSQRLDLGARREPASSRTVVVCRMRSDPAAWRARSARK